MTSRTIPRDSARVRVFPATWGSGRHLWRPETERLKGRRSAGFTLIEVIVTLVILAVMAALAIPAFLRDPVVADMDDAQGRLEALFRMARDSAVRSAMPVTVAFDSVTGYAWLDVPPSPLQSGVSGPGASRGSQTGEITLRAGGSFGGGSTLGRIAPGAGTASAGESLGLRPGVTLEMFRARALFTFSPDGTVQGDSIIIRGPYGEMRHLTLDPWGGHVRLR